MSSLKRARYATLLALTITVIAILGAGSLIVRQQYLTRGIPGGLLGPIPYGIPRLGVNVYLEQYEESELRPTLDAITATGIEFVKQPFYYHAAYDWALADRLMAAVERSGLTLVPLLDGNPADHFSPPADPALFAGWAAEFARRYGDAISYYIIWDEPNLAAHWGNRPANPNEYAALLTATAEAIRAADPDAVIIAAPLAPTTESGPDNLAEPLYLQQLYEAGAADAFDVVAAKPYGFDSGPDDRQVAVQQLNFSRAILLRELLERQGDGHKAVWAGNWGWNSLPAGWQGNPSIWGQTSGAQQADWTIGALERARREWPWMGIMFLENWEPVAPPTDPQWGFSIAGRETAAAIQAYLANQPANVANPGFHLAEANDPAQVYQGGWRFSPPFGADISETGDRVDFTFWGTAVGLRVRRADFRARLYVTVDGEPANALPADENGSTLVLTSADPSEDYLSIAPVARNLSPGVHTMSIVASRGWDQWALNGFSVGYHAPATWETWLIPALLSLAVAGLVVAVQQGRRADWGVAVRGLAERYGRLTHVGQLALTAATAALVTLSGWLTWGQEITGVYRRLSDPAQLGLTAGAAAIFYVSPWFIVYALALLALFVLLMLRPSWGVALIAFCMPFYVESVAKPVFQYHFSPVEIFTLVTVAAWLVHLLIFLHPRRSSEDRTQIHTDSHGLSLPFILQPADWAVVVFTVVATLSLFFSERVDVATNEWRVVILEPALFYLLLRGVGLRRSELWTVVDAFVLSGVVVALYGLWEYVGGDVITAEAGLLRLRSVFGSPNNVALYLGRLIPLLVAMVLLGHPRFGKPGYGWRWWGYGAALLPTGLAMGLTFSKGGLFLGLPAGLLVVFWLWRRYHGRRSWPWVVVAAVLGVTVIAVISLVPALAGRLGLFGATGVFRLNLWQASLNMFMDHPFFGVGLDNFLYEYRGRYILDAAWQEPNLNHPHNIFFDFATRLGLFGLLAGGWMIGEVVRGLTTEVVTTNGGTTEVVDDFTIVTTNNMLPVAVGFSGALAAMVAHGLVDHSFFLVDLAFVFYLILGTAVWLTKRITTDKNGSDG